jgi:hypothetical protein
MIEAKERPLPLIGELATKAWRGLKTQSRRPVKLPVPADIPIELRSNGIDLWYGIIRSGTTDVFRCPLGMPGDKIWIRERASIAALRGRRHVETRVTYDDGTRSDWFRWPSERLKWVPKLGHCIPNGCIREAARTVVTLSEVRIERVQDITSADAIAEGVVDPAHGWDGNPTYPRARFKGTWQSLYPDSWERNDWVWVYRWEPYRVEERHV